MANKQNTKSIQKTTETDTATVKVESKTGHKKPNIRVITESEEAVQGFLGFLRERAVVGLAVGFVVATQVQTVAKALIAGFIDPLFTLLFGGQLEKKHFVLSLHGRHPQFMWGSVVYALIDFIFVVAVIYVIIKVFKLDKLDKPKA